MLRHTPSRVSVLIKLPVIGSSTTNEPVTGVRIGPAEYELELELVLAEEVELLDELKDDELDDDILELDDRLEELLVL